MTLSTQFLTMLSMIGMGSMFGALLDTYNRFLKRQKRQTWIVFINDILFWILQALIIFYVLFLVNKGEIRFYIFLALLCGFAMYQSLLKSSYLKILETAISTVISVIHFLQKTFQILIYRPVVALLSFIFSVTILTGQGLLSLFRLLIRVIFLLIKVLLKPFELLLLLFWKLLPKGIKKYVEKLYNDLAGIFVRAKNYLYYWFNKLLKMLKFFK